MKKLAIITSHPIQYYAPIFKLLHERNQIEIKVFYSRGDKKSTNIHDPGFNRPVKWDLPLLEGYPFEWVENSSSGSHQFSGIKNPDLIQKITHWKPDAILVFGWAYNVHLRVLRHFRRKLPVYFRGDSTLLDLKPGWKNILKKWFLKWVYSHVDHAFYVGKQNRKYLLKYGLKESQLSFTPHAIDNKRFSENRTTEANELRNKLGIGRNHILILFAGKFEKKKSPGLLLKAFSHNNAENTHLLFVGNGVLEKELKAQASTLPMQDGDELLSITEAIQMHEDGCLGNKTRIHFMDFQNQTEMPVVYQASDLFCLPSKGPGESWGLAVNEAMACGKAILVSDKVGSAYDLVKKGKNGFIFKSGNVSDLKEKLEHLTSCRKRLQEFGIQSNKMISEWNFEAIARVIETRLMNEPQR